MRLVHKLDDVIAMDNVIAMQLEHAARLGATEIGKGFLVCEEPFVPGLQRVLFMGADLLDSDEETRDLLDCPPIRNALAKYDPARQFIIYAVEYQVGTPPMTECNIYVCEYQFEQPIALSA